MNTPLKLLLIDDNPDDRSLVMRELRREFPTLEATQITDKKGFDRALEGDCFDLAITDYQLLWTNGVTVLKTLKARWPDCPVIMFTGTGSEEIAVEAMKAGLTDYVLKSPRHFARLPAAAQAALRAARHKRELAEAEERYTVLFASVPIGLYRATPGGEIMDANPALAKLLGYADRSELIGKNAADLHATPAEFERWRTAMERSGEVPRLEVQLRCRDGRLCWVENHGRAIRDTKTRRIQYEGSIEDITERKLAEQERERLIAELQEALARVKTLSGLLPICASCKKIRDDKGSWNQIEVYIQEHSEAEFTHSFCPECLRRLYPEVFPEKATFQ